MRFATISILIVLIFIIMIVALIGVYVYKDASHRGMNAALWTIVAVFAPSLIGLIVYLLVRGNYSDLNCPNCTEKVTDDFVVCPQCGAKLKSICPNCGFPYESGWTVCPKCATSLPEQSFGVTPPSRKNDKALSKILIAVILIPALLLFGFVLLTTTVSQSRFGLSSASFIPVEEYAAEKNNPEITKWLNSCDTGKQEVYALRYMTEKEGQKSTSFAIYFPFDLYDAIGTDIERSFFKEYAMIEFGGDAHKFVDAKYNFLLFSSTADTYLTLKATYHGQEVPCSVTDVDFDLSLTEDETYN